MNPSQQSNYWIGQLIGERSRYRIVTRLGGGGMGDVFLATDTLLGQQVAVKMLKERLVHETEVKQRFEREALLCAAIQGEHVVEVKDYGITNEGFPFFVMEYLQGQTLGQLLREEKRLSVERTVRIISQVCDGLFKAHSGVVMSHNSAQSSEVVKFVHRDLKPENIFLVNTSLGELVKVLDFGIAKVFSNDAECTNTGLFVGTFQYAAPEQIESRKDLDLRADIYSIGMILYEMLCGTDPFGCLQEGRLGVNCLR
jgi:serine/threonine-protein kinase